MKCYLLSVSVIEAVFGEYVPEQGNTSALHFPHLSQTPSHGPQQRPRQVVARYEAPRQAVLFGSWERGKRGGW